MNISTFLTEQLNLTVPEQTRNALDRLAGRKVRFTRFYVDLEEATKWTMPWMPLYFLPIAKQDMYWYGFHLTPENRAVGRLPIIKAARNPISERVEATEIAPTLERYLQRIMLEWEAEFEEDFKVLPEDRPLEEEMAESLPLLRELFGPDFYTSGRREFYIHDEKWDEYYFGSPGEITIQHLDGSPYDYAEKLWPLSDDRLVELKAVAEEGCRRFPNCFALHLALAKIYRKLDNSLAAAQSINNAIGCYHHTAHDDDPQQAYELGRELLNKHPDAFAPFMLDALDERSDVDRVKWIVSFVAQNQTDRTVKLLDDLCFDWQQYETPYVLDFFKHLFGLLGWQWAIPLCDLRYPSEKLTQRSYSSAQADVWNRLVKQYTGLE